MFRTIKSKMVFLKKFCLKIVVLKINSFLKLNCLKKLGLKNVILEVGLPQSMSFSKKFVLEIGRPRNWSSSKEVVLEKGHPRKKSSSKKVVLEKGRPRNRSSSKIVVSKKVVLEKELFEFLNHIIVFNNICQVHS